MFKWVFKKGIIILIMSLIYGSCVPSDESETLNSEGFIINIGSKDTFLKRTLAINTSIEDGRGSDFCTLYANSEYKLDSTPLDIGNHIKVHVSNFTEKGCDFDEGYVFKTHLVSELPQYPNADSANIKPQTYRFQGISPVVIGTVRAGEFSPSVKAFLDTIAAAEGTSNTGTFCGLADDGYGSQYRCYADSTRVFTNYQDHPRKKFMTPWGQYSSASGRYQFLISTWDRVRKELDLKDFSPKSQDRGAVRLLVIREAKKNVEAIGSNNRWEFYSALDKVACEWASIPKMSDSSLAKRGGCHEQPIKSRESLWNLYRSAYKLYALN